jgi:hypothetical protein
MAWILILLCFDMRSVHRTIEASCDVIELNHVYDARGCFVYRQVILWRFMPEDGNLHTFGWRLVKPDEDAIHGSDGRWKVYGEGAIVTAPTVRMSWSQCDPEMQDRRSYWKGHQPPNLFERVKTQRFEGE